jgi:hypothetical protein
MSAPGRYYLGGAQNLGEQVSKRSPAPNANIGGSVFSRKEILLRCLFPYGFGYRELEYSLQLTHSRKLNHATNYNIFC